MKKLKDYNNDDLKHLQRVELKILKDVISICENHNLKYYAYGGTALGAIRHGGFIPWDDDVDIVMFRDDYEKLLKIMETELSDEYYVLNFRKQKYYCYSFTEVCLKGTSFHNLDEYILQYDKGICIDIFPLDNVPKSRLKQIIHHYRVTILYHLVVNSIHKINTPNKILSLIHSITHYTLKAIPGYKFLKKRYYKCLIKYNKKETDYATVFFSQVDFLNFGKYGFFEKKDFEPTKKVKFENIEINIQNNYDKILTTYYGDYMTLPPKEKRYNNNIDILDFGKY